MKLYHGTNAVNLGRILKKGLLPRGKHDGNWESAPSHPNCVYLTNAYAPYFCFTGDKATDGAVIEVETDMLNERNLLPDEDMVEQSGRGYDGINAPMLARVALIRKDLHKYCNGQWDTSLQAMGTCAHLGKISVEAITRVAVIPFEYHWFWDASICIQNYRFLGARYQAQMARLFGDPPKLFSKESALFADQWQFPMSGHTVSQVRDGKLVETKTITAPDERKRWSPDLELIQASELKHD